MENKITTEWTTFDGEYEKEYYDIELEDGKIYQCCYPNAGEFHCLENLGKIVRGSDVVKIRKCKWHPMKSRRQLKGE